MSVISIEVLYALPDRQIVLQLELPAGSTAADAVTASGLQGEFPEIASTASAFARYGRLISRLEPLRDGDRIEILRPLQVDPKQARRLSAAKSARNRDRTRPRR
jgi:putative ubiquitin-RnfH superfamily antitoxin RatB of RatAB toxin-antitoxin module